jgi:hypothetical protein
MTIPASWPYRTPSQAIEPDITELITPSDFCSELTTWLFWPPPAATGPVALVLVEPETPEFKTPELACSLLRTPAAPNSPALASNNPFTPAPGKAFDAELAAVLELVEDALLRTGDEVVASATVKPLLPVDDEETEQFTCR